MADMLSWAVFFILRRITIFQLILLGIVSMANAQDIIPLAELKPGTKCYGLSVFRGVDPERFECTILGVVDEVPDWPKGAGFKSIVAQLWGGPLNERNVEILKEAGVLSGMSGSPVYTLDGKIIGSVMAHFTGSKTPLAFLMPIEMTLNFHPLTMSQPNRWLKEGADFKSFIGTAETASLKAGEAFAACEMWGDENDCAGATVIMVDPKNHDTVHLTGHSSDNVNKGIVAVPIFKAEVVTSESNLLSSRKIFKAIGDPIGTMIFNSPFGGIGKLGVLPKSFGVEVSLYGLFGKAVKSNKYNL